VNEKNELIAGYRRIKACKLLGWKEIPVNRINLDDVMRGENDENTWRKDFNAEERVAIGGALEEREKELAKKRMIGAGIAKKKGEKITSEKFAEDTGRALEKVANIVGWSRPTYEKAKAVVEAAETNAEKFNDLRENLDDGIESCFKELQRRQELEKRRIEVKNAPKLKNLILGDAVEKIEEIPDGSIDLLFTDPPYGRTVMGVVGRGMTRKLKEGDRWDYLFQNDPAIFPLLDKLFEKAVRKLKPDAHVYIYTNWQSLGELIGVVGKHLTVKNCIVNHYGVSLGTRDNTNYRNSYNLILFATNGGRRKLGGLWPSNHIATKRMAEIKHHPAEKSVETCEMVIKNSTVEGETVLDPFAGSGTTLVAAENLGRNWIGIEIDPHWHEVANARILESRKNNGGVINEES
jgi:site-specific DNA-methyltransferase (adenine-specific)